MLDYFETVDHMVIPLLTFGTHSLKLINEVLKSQFSLHLRKKIAKRWTRKRFTRIL